MLSRNVVTWSQWTHSPVDRHRYDYSVLPQHPRTPVEQEAFASLLSVLNDIQFACSRFVIVDTLAGLPDYCSRAWCVCEMYVASSSPNLKADVHRPGHAVAASPRAYLELCVALVMLAPQRHDDTRFGHVQTSWTCPRCGGVEAYTVGDSHEAWIDAHRQTECQPLARELAQLRLLERLAARVLDQVETLEMIMAHHAHVRVYTQLQACHATAWQPCCPADAEPGPHL
jgi:hypothetical protein